MHEEALGLGYKADHDLVELYFVASHHGVGQSSDLPGCRKLNLRGDPVCRPVAVADSLLRGGPTVLKEQQVSVQIAHQREELDSLYYCVWVCALLQHWNYQLQGLASLQEQVSQLCAEVDRLVVH